MEWIGSISHCPWLVRLCSLRPMSRLPFELFLAFRYLRPKRTFVSAITLLSVIGVTLGVAVLIIVISVMSGFDREMKDKILGFNSHMKVMSAEGTMKHPRQVASLVASNGNVTGVSPFVMGQVFVEAHSADGSSRVLAPVVRGVDPATESRVSRIPSSIVTGNFDVRGNGVVLGVELARKLRLQVGDSMSIYSIRNLKSMRDVSQRGAEEVVLPDDFEVRGIFDIGHFEFNELYVAASMGSAQDLYGLGADAHGLLVNVKEPEHVEQVRLELSALLGPEYEVVTWMDENGHLLDALVVEKNVMFYILFFIMIVAAFGITSVLITFVVQKTKEIGVLKALGATQMQVMWLFLSQSVLVGILGVALGFGLGWLGVQYRNEFLAFMRQVTGFELFPARIYSFSKLPALFVPSDIAVICLGSLVICVLAGLLPAWNASRLHPVEALRHE